MSGKYANKRPHTGGSKKQGSVTRTRKKLIAALIIIALTLIASIALLIILDKTQIVDIPDLPGQVEASAPSETTEDTSVPEDTANISPNQDVTFTLDRGLEIIKIGKYTGMFMEDGTDDAVSDVLMIMVRNNGSEKIQYAKVKLSSEETEAYFEFSTLMPGETVIVLEKNRMDYTTAPEFTQATAENIAVFKQAPTLCEEQIRIQCLDGILNITNISGQDITGDIKIYYKNYSSDMYHGGITYLASIKGGLEADEIRQIVCDHFTENGSKVVFVTIG